MVRDQTDNLDKARQLLAQGHSLRAAAACKELLVTGPVTLALLMLYGRASEQAGDLDTMLRVARQAVELKPNNTDASLRLAEANLKCGHQEEGLAMLKHMEETGSNRQRLLHRVAEVHRRRGRHEDAQRCSFKAVELKPDNAKFVFTAARSCLALGQNRQAERLYDRVINLQPDHYDAWQQRSLTRKQTNSDNHIKNLSFALDHLPQGTPGRVPLCYALAKEFDDIDHYDESFVCLENGARQKSKGMNYDVAADEQRMKDIEISFTRLAGADIVDDREGPVFVVGLPESGAGLVGDIISAHSMAGKVAITDFMRVGQIRTTVPAARLIHVHRHPLDQCYALFRKYYRRGNEFSYDLQDMARYYIAYTRLMKHWRAVTPGAILDLNYDQLVTTRRRQVSNLLETLGLEWEEACLEAHIGPDTALDRWRCYERQLAPLREILQEAGIPLS